VKNAKNGLSLMEVMITLVIVAIIAGLAYPRYQKMVTRSKQTEAKTMLQAIYVAQDLYRTANQGYAAHLDALDLSIPETAQYHYSITITDGGAGFTAKASADIDSDPTLDEWQIDHHNRLVNTINDVID
jgi:type IV pilus assembly protein PilE